jgi:hypothetical protein
MRSGGGAATSRPKGSSGWNAQHLLRVASDDAATPHERQSAYAKARHELDGLMALPAITRAGIERRIAGRSRPDGGESTRIPQGRSAVSLIPHPTRTSNAPAHR